MESGLGGILFKKEGERMARGYFHVGQSPGREVNFGTSGSKKCKCKNGRKDKN